MKVYSLTTRKSASSNWTRVATSSTFFTRRPPRISGFSEYYQSMSLIKLAKVHMESIDSILNLILMLNVEGNAFLLICQEKFLKYLLDCSG